MAELIPGGHGAFRMLRPCREKSVVHRGVCVCVQGEASFGEVRRGAMGWGER